jgi:hypothetical protein
VPNFIGTGSEKTMRGTFGILLGCIIVAVGLAGLGEALMQMMTHADPHASMKAAGGLGAFVLASVFMMILATRA